MESDEYYMRQAIMTAKKHIEKEEYPFGCCIVTKDGKHIVTSGNTCFSNQDPTQHAEINAIKELCNKLGRMTLENTVIYTTTEPCVMCIGAINWAKIPRLVYGLSINDSVKYGFQEINLLTSEEIIPYFPYEIDIRGNILQDECIELFELWKKRNKVMNWYRRKNSLK